MATAKKGVAKNAAGNVAAKKAPAKKAAAKKALVMKAPAKKAAAKNALAKKAASAAAPPQQPGLDAQLRDAIQGLLRSLMIKRRNDDNRLPPDLVAAIGDSEFDFSLAAVNSGWGPTPTDALGKANLEAALRAVQAAKVATDRVVNGATCNAAQVAVSAAIDALDLLA